MTEKQLARFLAKVNVTETCWLWTGSKDKGYGRFMLDGRRRPGKRPYGAHRVAYEHFVGPIPDGLQIDHLCRNPGCVNPDHLEAVTNAENMRRVFVHECRRGHVRTPENTYITPAGHRSCRACSGKRYPAFPPGGVTSVWQPNARVEGK